MDLPDINVWLALAFESHEHHHTAKDWFDTTAGAQFCRYTQSGFLRLASNPVVFGSDAVSLREAWRLFDRLNQDERVGWEEEPFGVESSWRRFTSHGRFSPKVWNDTYLAAFAAEGGHRIVTFDRGFEGFHAVNKIIL